MRKRGQLPGKATLEGDDAVRASARTHAGLSHPRATPHAPPTHGATNRLCGVAGGEQEQEQRWDQVVTRVRDSNFQMGLRITHLEGYISSQVRPESSAGGGASRQQVTATPSLRGIDHIAQLPHIGCIPLPRQPRHSGCRSVPVVLDTRCGTAERALLRRPSLVALHPRPGRASASVEPERW
jgi:hypothetical protein